MPRTAETLQEAVEIAKGGGWCMCLCPAHEDGTPSLRVAAGTSQPVVFHCHAGCEADAILTAAGMTWDDVSEEGRPAERSAPPADRDRWTPKGTASNVYSYRSPSGREVFQVLRVPLEGGKKTFFQRHKGADGKWVWNMDGVERVLYRLPEVIECRDAGEDIILVEGEKDAETAVRLGLCATTSPQGAGKWQRSFTDHLAGSKVVLIADADATGRAHMRTVRDALLGAGCTVQMLEPIAGCKDLTDHIEAGHKFTDLIETAPDTEPEPSNYGIDLVDFIQRRVSDVEFIVPGLLARGDRLMITAYEGSGKSMTLRQIAACTAMGVHPFKFDAIEPKRVLHIDGENHPDQVLYSWQDLVGRASSDHYPGRLERGMLTILSEWEGNTDLLTGDGRAWLIERVHAYKPDLITIGPLYALTGHDLADSDAVKLLRSIINEARSLYSSAVVMEHHAPHKGPNDTRRSIRPYGHSTFLRWPEFGYGLLPVPAEQGGVRSIPQRGEPPTQETLYEFHPFRQPRVRGRGFPPYLRQGRPNSVDFPWVPIDSIETFSQGF